MNVTILDYGVGNLHSLAKALDDASSDISIESDPVRAIETDVLVLPGVGAFGAAARHIAPARSRLQQAIADGLPVIGICLGMQLLFDESEEADAETRGLGVVAGRVTRLRAQRVPQIGWNRVEPTGANEGAALPDVAYYANGFACRPDDERCVVAWSEHERDRFPAAVRAGNVVGVQFHPEKSGRAGVSFLRALVHESARR